MGVVRPGTLGPAPLGAGTKCKAAGDGFFASRCKAEGGGKKLATDVAGDERGEADLRSDPCQSSSLMERPSREIGGIRQWRPSLRLDARERKRRGFRWPIHRRPDLYRHGPDPAFRGRCRTCGLFSHLRCADRARRCRRSTRTMSRRSSRPNGRSVFPGFALPADRLRAARSPSSSMSMRRRPRPALRTLRPEGFQWN